MPWIYGFQHRSFPSTLHYPITLYLQQHDKLLQTGTVVRKTLIYLSYLHIFLFVNVSGCLFRDLLHVRWRWLPVVLHRVLWRQRGAALWKRQLLQVRNSSFSQTYFCPAISHSISHFIPLAPWHFVTLHFHNRSNHPPPSHNLWTVQMLVFFSYSAYWLSLREKCIIYLSLATNCQFSYNLVSTPSSDVIKYIITFPTVFISVHSCQFW